MAIISMKKLTVLVPKAQAETLTKQLQRMRCVQINEIKPDAVDDTGAVRRFDADIACNEAEQKLAGIEEACRILEKYDQQKKKGLFPPPIEVTEALSAERGEELMHTVERTRELVEKIKTAKAAMQTCKMQEESLAPWESLDLAPAKFTTAKTQLLTGILPISVDVELLGQDLSEIAWLETVSYFKKDIYVAVLVNKANAEECLRRLTEKGFSRLQLGDASLSPAEQSKALAEQEKEIEKSIEQYKAELDELAKNLHDLKILSDETADAAAAYRAESRFVQTKTVAALEGWVPETKVEKVNSLLEMYECAWEWNDPAPEDDPPILLKNNRFAASFEMVLGMYSYPKYGTYDPTFIMSIFYFLIFGMMFADVGYGLLLVFGCFGILKFTKVRGSFRKFLTMFGYCGISCTVCGVLFGGYFADFPLAFMRMIGLEPPQTLALAIDPMLDFVKFMVVSLAIGAVHLITGMAIKFYILWKQGKWVDALCDIATYWLLFIGIGCLVLFPDWGKWVAIAGALSIFLTQGRAKKGIIGKAIGGFLGLYGLINYVSDLLSYSRILALGLASAVVGQVVNTLSTMGGATPIGFLLMIVVFLFGHVLNIVINLLGTFVHTARLQYIEFFGKFYEDGGKPFRPMAPVEKYTETVEPTKENG